MSKTSFIISSIAILLFMGLMLFFLIGILCEQYPSEDALTFQECTFMKWEKKTAYRNVRYFVYVEEYEAPLEIDNIVLREVNKDVLSQLKQGDKVTVSISESKNKWKIYAFSYQGISILSFEDYLSRHKLNDRIGTILCSAIAIALLGGFVANIVYYRKNGNIKYYRAIKREWKR